MPRIQSHDELELGVEDIQQAVGKSPQEEQNRGERNRGDGFLVVQLEHTRWLLHIDKVEKRDAAQIRARDGVGFCVSRDGGGMQELQHVHWTTRVSLRFDPTAPTCGL